MRSIRLLPLLICTLTAGCSWFDSNLPGREPAVPLTPPSELNASAADELSADEPTVDEPEVATHRADLLAAAGPDEPTGSGLSRPAKGPTLSTDLAQPAEARPRGEVVTAQAIQVDGSYICVADVLEAARPELMDLPPDISKPLFARQARDVLGRTIERLIRESLVYAEAANRMNEQLNARIDADVAEAERLMIARAGGSRKRLERQMIDQGTTLERVLTNHRRQLVIAAFIQQQFQANTHVTPRELWQYYCSHTDEFSQAPRVAMQIIEVPFSAFYPPESKGFDPTAAEKLAAREQAAAEMKKATERLAAGEDFAEVAKDVSRGPRASEGGSWDLMAKGSFAIKPVEDAAFSLDQGQVSDVIETDEGLFLVRAAQVEKARRESFEQAQPKIAETLRDQKYSKAVEEYEQKLLKKAIVRRNGRLLELAVDAAVEGYWKGRGE